MAVHSHHRVNADGSDGDEHEHRGREQHVHHRNDSGNNNGGGGNGDGDAGGRSRHSGRSTSHSRSRRAHRHDSDDNGSSDARRHGSPHHHRHHHHHTGGSDSERHGGGSHSHTGHSEHDQWSEFGSGYYARGVHGYGHSQSSGTTSAAGGHDTPLHTPAAAAVAGVSAAAKSSGVSSTDSGFVKYVPLLVQQQRMADATYHKHVANRIPYSHHHHHHQHVSDSWWKHKLLHHTHRHHDHPSHHLAVATEPDEVRKASSRLLRRASMKQLDTRGVSGDVGGGGGGGGGGGRRAGSVMDKGPPVVSADGGAVDVGPRAQLLSMADRSVSFDKVGTHQHVTHGEHAHVHERVSLRRFLESRAGHLSVVLVVLLDMLVVLVEIIIVLSVCGTDHEHAHGVELAEETLRMCSVVLLSCMLGELLLRAKVYGVHYFLGNVFHLIDPVVVVISLAGELFLHGYAKDIVALLIVLRLWRIVRIVHAIIVEAEFHEQQLRNELLSMLNVERAKCIMFEERLGRVRRRAKKLRRRAAAATKAAGTASAPAMNGGNATGGVSPLAAAAAADGSVAALGTTDVEAVLRAMGDAR